MNKSQENWSDVQLSLSTATPSLGGALPKLATLKIGYEVPRYNYNYNNICLAQCAKRSSRFSASNLLPGTPSFMRNRAQSSFTSSATEDFQDQSDIVNVLAAQTEASMSSTSFTIPRRATIDADVSSFSSNVVIFKNDFLPG